VTEGGTTSTRMGIDMGILARARCKAGRHSGQWSHPGVQCEVVRVCDSCGKQERRTQHVWSPFGYVEPDRCEQARRCERCGTTESRIRHEWGPWFYLNNEFGSPQVHSCLRCRQSERTSYTMR
jgi:hypothetical protein